MSNGVPARRLEDILSLPPQKLSESERHLVKMYQAGLEMQREDEDGGEKVFGKIEVQATKDHAIFMMPDGTTVKELECVILQGKIYRNWYGDKTNGDDGPMYCFSAGGKDGNPTEAGLEDISFLRSEPNSCASCPSNMFGSGERNSKACRETRRLIIKHASFQAPLQLNVSSTSLRAWDSYLNTASNNGVFLCSIWTKIKATPKGEGKMWWGVLQFERGDSVGTDEAQNYMSLHLELEHNYQEYKKGLALKSAKPESDDKPDPVSDGPISDQPPPPNDDDLPF